MGIRRIQTVAAMTLAGVAGAINVAHAAPPGTNWQECRGVAIMSPIDSPDPCSPPVGGRPQWVPYYTGYWRDCPPMNYLPPSAYWTGLSQGQGYYSPGSYGPYTGARRDEANLLRLGATGAGNGYYPKSRPADFIDMRQFPQQY